MRTPGNQQLRDLQSIISGLFYLSEESFRCGLESVSAQLRRSIMQIIADAHTQDMSEHAPDVMGEQEILELFSFLDVIRGMDEGQKQETLRLLQQSSLRDIH